MLIFDEIFGSRTRSAGTTSSRRCARDGSRFPRILLISPIAEMPGEFANTPVIEMGADGSEPGSFGGVKEDNPCDP